MYETEASLSIRARETRNTIVLSLGAAWICCAIEPLAGAVSANRTPMAGAPRGGREGADRGPFLDALTYSDSLAAETASGARVMSEIHIARLYRAVLAAVICGR